VKGGEVDIKIRARKEIQSESNESPESVSVFVHAQADAQMNTDGHAKGSVFDGSHSRCRAVPLIPIYAARIAVVGVVEGTERVLRMTVNIGHH
jgi:hypothetical protein